MVKIYSIVILFSVFCLCASAEVDKDISSGDPLTRDNFNFPAPSVNDLNEKINLWSTYYYLPQLGDRTGGIALRDMKSMELGPQLSLQDWCNSALEGSVRITDQKNEVKTYNYAGTSSENPVDCSRIFRFDLSKTKFREARGPYGDGILDYILAPYRTIATDSNIISPGSVLYIPSARGAQITLDNGRIIIHDGYFFAGDKGGAIKGNHIDVFIGTHKSAPFFPWIKNSKDKTFDAYVVSDKKVISDLKELHLLQ